MARRKPNEKTWTLWIEGMTDAAPESFTSKPTPEKMLSFFLRTIRERYRLKNDDPRARKIARSLGLRLALSSNQAQLVILRPLEDIERESGA